MGRLGALGVCTGLLCLAAAATVDAAPRGGFFTPGSAPRAPEIMLYFNHPVGSGAAAATRPTFGLRVQQIRQSLNTGDPEQGDAMQHREIINWQMEGRSNLHVSNMRVKLGNKLTYDVSNQRFGSPATRSAIQLGTPSLRNGTVTFTPAHMFASRSPAETALGVRESAAVGARDSNRDNSAFHEIAAAALVALTPARFTTTQRQMAQRQGGFPVMAVAQRLQTTTALR